MRCSTAVSYALLTNRKFKRTKWLINDSQKAVKKSFNRKMDNCELLCLLSPKFGKSIIEAHIPRLIRAQRSTGGWKQKDIHRITLSYLDAFNHTSILDDMLKKLKHNPFRLFEGGKDIFSLLAHVKYPSHLDEREADKEIKRECNDIRSKQEKNGSWDNSVLSTSHHLLLLSQFGIGKGDRTLKRGAEFIFSSFINDVIRNSKNHGGMVVAHHMFSNEERGLEFLAAKQYKPEWDPKQLCFNHLPNVQSAYAVYCLNLLGYQDDSRVIQSCQNFIDMHKTYGGFCDGNIRNTIMEKERVQ